MIFSFFNFNVFLEEPIVLGVWEERRDLLEWGQLWKLSFIHAGLSPRVLRVSLFVTLHHAAKQPPVARRPIQSERSCCCGRWREMQYFSQKNTTGCQGCSQWTYHSHAYHTNLGLQMTTMQERSLAVEDHRKLLIDIHSVFVGKCKEVIDCLQMMDRQMRLCMFTSHYSRERCANCGFSLMKTERIKTHWLRRILIALSRKRLEVFSCMKKFSLLHISSTTIPEKGKNLLWRFLWQVPCGSSETNRWK